MNPPGMASFDCRCVAMGTSGDDRAVHATRPSTVRRENARRWNCRVNTLTRGGFGEGSGPDGRGLRKAERRQYTSAPTEEPENWPPVAATLNGRFLATVQATPGWQELRFAVPPDVWLIGANELKLTCGSTTPPILVGLGDDPAAPGARCPNDHTGARPLEEE